LAFFFGAAATALLVPGVKSKVTDGDYEGALNDAKDVVTSIEGVPGKAAYVGGVVAVDALAHLPVLGFFLPGPLQARSDSHWSPYDRVRVVNADH
jgi:hypothetical protein